VGVVSNTCTDTGSRFGDLLWVVYEYTFGDASVVTVGPKKMPDMVAAQAECDALIPTIEDQATEQARQLARERLRDRPPNPELVIPTQPDELPESDPSESVDTRQRGFHRWLFGTVWPEDLIEVFYSADGVYQWVDQMTNPNQQTYLGIDGATRIEISQRMGNAKTVGDLVDADEPGDLAI